MHTSSTHVIVTSVPGAQHHRFLRLHLTVEGVASVQLGRLPLFYSELARKLNPNFYIKNVFEDVQRSAPFFINT